MTAYIIKIILCSALFLLVYFLFLEKEKMYRFNRFYLLFSIVFSLIIPFLTIHIEKDAPLKTVSEFVFSPVEMASAPFPPQEILQDSPIKTALNKKDILLLIYWLITAFFLIKFAVNLVKMYSKIKGKKSIAYKGSRLILTEENLTPHSFLNWIFLNKTDFENEEIEEEILWHELTHIKQYHTIDVLLIELLTVFFWFNPFVYLYRKAIKLNHEFLADDGVISRFQNIQTYQYLLLAKVNQQTALAYTSQFNFLITKKRLIMITKNTSPKMAFLKYGLVVTILIIAVFAFSAKSIVAQKIKDTTQPMAKSIAKPKDSVNLMHFGNYAGGTKQGVTTESLTEYKNIINKTKTPEMSWIKFRETIPELDSKRLEQIFMQMNLKQQVQQTVVFIKPFKPLPKGVPSQTQFENFKKPKIYGVWLNGKKISNSELNNYMAKDFAQVFVSKLYGPAKKDKSYSYQVNMMTKDYYQAYYDRTIADKSNEMMFQSRRNIKK